MNTLKKWLVKLFCLALLSVANLYIIAQRSHIVGEFKGTVYFIPQDEIMMGYGEHVYDNDVIGEVSSSSLQYAEADQYEEPFPGVERGSQFGIVYYSILNVIEEGCYAFNLESDDGSMLWMDDNVVLNNDRPHKLRFKSDTISLRVKEYDIKVWYYNAFPPRYGLKFNIEFLGQDAVCEEWAGSDELSLTLGDILFDTDSYMMTEEGVNALHAFCEDIEVENVVEISITGHTDDSGSEEYNAALSMRRAEQVSAHITRVLRVDRNDLTLRVDGAGESAPVASNDSEAGRKANRRVEVVFRLR